MATENKGQDNKASSEPKAAKPEVRSVMEETLKDAAGELVSTVTKVLSPLLMIIAVAGGIMVGIAGLFSSPAATKLYGELKNFLRMTGLAALLGVSEITDNWDAIRHTMGDTANALISRLKLVGWIVIILAVLACLAILVKWYALGAIFIMLIATSLFIAGSIVQSAFGRWSWGNNLYLLCAKFAVAVFFIAACVMALPQAMSNPTTIVSILVLIGLGISYLLLLGRSSTRLYKAMLVVGIVMVVTTLLVGIMPPQMVNLGKEAWNGTMSLVNTGAVKVNTVNLKKYKVTVAGTTKANGNEEEKKKDKPVEVKIGELAPCDVVLVDESTATKIGNYPFYYFWVQKCDKGDVVAEGYFPSDLMAAVEPPPPPPGEKKSEPSAPVGKVASTVAPSSRPIPVQPAVLVARPDQTTAEVGPEEWTDSGIILKPGEHCQWFQVTDFPEKGDFGPCQAGVLETLEYVYGIPGAILPIQGRKIAKNPIDHGWFGLCHVDDANLNNDHLFVRVARGEETVKIKFLLVKREAQPLATTANS